jgi:hypothetical protein
MPRALLRALGYTADSWSILRDDLLRVASSAETVPTQHGPYGQKFELRATLTSPLGRTAPVVTVGIVRVGENFPRFATAFPA